MGNFSYYIWVIILLLYILSPRDLYPGLIDDLLALGLLIYLRFKNAKQKMQRSGPYTHGKSGENVRNESYRYAGINDAYRILGISPNASWEEIKKSYREKIAKTHPDKVNHLSRELQEKAKEMTLKLNNALEIIKTKRNIK